MTREECSKWLKSLKIEIGKSEHEALWHYAEAIDMALSALSSADVAFITVPKNCSDCWDKNLHVAVDCNAKGECGEDGEKRREDCPLIRPQGEWKHTITGQPYCSICEYVYSEDEEFNPFWSYCPNCGVKIKMEE